MGKAILLVGNSIEKIFMKGRSFFDTNIILYRDDAACPEKQKIAVNLLDACWQSNTAVMSTQVLQEYFSAATRKLGVPVEIARRKIELFASMGVASIEHDDILVAIDLHRLHSFSFWDALIVTMAQKTACRTLYSEDMQHGRQVWDVTIVNPFVQ